LNGNKHLTGNIVTNIVTKTDLGDQKEHLSSPPWRGHNNKKMCDFVVTIVVINVCYCSGKRAFINVCYLFNVC